MTSTNRSVDAVRRHYDAFARGDMDAFLATYAEDAVVEHAESLPFGGAYRGRDEIGRLVRAFEERWPEAEVTPVQVAASEAWVLVLTRYRGRTASANDVDMQAVEAFLLDESAAIARHVIFFFDTQRLREAL